LLAHAAADDPVGLEKMKQTLLERPQSQFEMSDAGHGMHGGSKIIKDDQRVKLNLSFKGHGGHGSEKSHISIPVCPLKFSCLTMLALLSSQDANSWAQDLNEKWIVH
jgi:hypothetical protein